MVKQSGLKQSNPERQQYVWDLFVRVFHWSLVTAFSVAFYYHASEWDRLIHVRAGYVAGALIIARIIWGLVATGYANFKSFPLNPIFAFKHLVRALRGNAKHYIGHNPTGAVAIYAMLGVGLIAVTSGFLLFNDGWLIDEPEIFQTIHQFATWGWLVLVGIHVSGVLFESFLHGDNLIWSMITGCKRVCKIDERMMKNKIRKG